MARDANNEPYRSTELYVTCVNSPYYEDYIPSILREIIERSQPEGFADNSWSGLERDSICYCENCRRKFKDRTGHAIPGVKNWDDPVYRQWIAWNYARRLEIWDLNNRATRDAGGPHCLWMGMNGGSIAGQAKAFRDFKAICERSEIIMLDNQARNDASGFQSNGESGKLIHGLLGWDKLIPESMAMYQAGRPMFRWRASPNPRRVSGCSKGFAGGIQPWWHHLGAYQEDRRMLQTAGPVLGWHAQNQQYLINRRPMATVGLVWSQQNSDFYGRDNVDELVDLPWRGWTNALVRARIPYLPVHADHIVRDADQLSVLILPNFAAMTGAQIQAVKNFVQRGGGLIATGDSSRCNEWGEPQMDFALAGLFGAHLPDDSTAESPRRTTESLHSYLRLTPEIASRANGCTKTGKELPVVGERHPALKGFDETDILPFGGTLRPLRVDSGALVLATFIPPFPAFPPENVWMREPRTDIPGLMVNEVAGRGRVTFLPADLDRRFGRDNLPDHGNLLADLVRWAARDELPLAVTGAGFVDCHLYRQEKNLVLHLVNLTNAGTWRAPVDELIRVGPLKVRVKLPEGMRGHNVQLLVSNRTIKTSAKHGWMEFELPEILDHEVVVVS